MRNSLVVGLVALSLAFVPAPRAQAQDMGDAVAGLAALAIVGAILSQRAEAKDDDGDRGRRVTRGYAPPPQRARPDRGLPARCELPGRRGHGLYGERCLHRAGIRTGRLPHECRVHLGRGSRTAVDGRCLRREAWRR